MIQTNLTVPDRTSRIETSAAPSRQDKGKETASTPGQADLFTGMGDAVNEFTTTCLAGTVGAVITTVGTAGAFLLGAAHEMSKGNLAKSALNATGSAFSAAIGPYLGFNRSIDEMMHHDVTFHTMEPKDTYAIPFKSTVISRCNDVIGTYNNIMGYAPDSDGYVAELPNQWSDHALLFEHPENHPPRLFIGGK